MTLGHTWMYAPATKSTRAYDWPDIRICIVTRNTQTTRMGGGGGPPPVGERTLRSAMARVVPIMPGVPIYVCECMVMMMMMMGVMMVLMMIMAVVDDVADADDYADDAYRRTN